LHYKAAGLFVYTKYPYKMATRLCTSHHLVYNSIKLIYYHGRRFDIGFYIFFFISENEDP